MAWNKGPVSSRHRHRCESRGGDDTSRRQPFHQMWKPRQLAKSGNPKDRRERHRPSSRGMAPSQRNDPPGAKRTSTGNEPLRGTNLAAESLPSTTAEIKFGRRGADSHAVLAKRMD